jgi:hypothetical protein
MMPPSILLQTFSESRERAFEWANLPPAWVVFLVVVPLVAFFVAYFYRREKPADGRRMRPLLGILRAAVILAVLALIARPMARETVYQTRDPQILVLVDDSLSMKIGDKYPDRSVPQDIGSMLHMSPEGVERTGRYDLVARVLRDPAVKFLEGLRRRGKVALWTFSGRPKKVIELPRLGGGAAGDGTAAEVADAGGGLPPYEKVQGEDRVKLTRLGDALNEAVWGGGRGLVRDEPGSAAIVLFTDGQQNAGSLQPEEVARKFGQRGIPIYTVGVGNPEPAKDIAVIDLDASDVVLVGDKVSFEASLTASGFAGERVKVELYLNEELADSQNVTLDGGDARQLVRLQHTPKSPGDFTATVKVEALPSELFEENNVKSRPLKVLDQKIKVLYLEGPPRWEYRYLMHQLIRDPTMEAQVYLYSADPGFFQESSPGIPALTKDPRSPNFPDSREALFRYHVVIIGDIDPDTDKLTSEEMELLKDFVSEAGGGIVFIAGQNANPSAFLHTPLEGLLPVEVPASGLGGAEARAPTTPFNVKLTGVGKEHPVLRLVNDPERNVELLENPLGIDGDGLPGFYWFAEVNREKKGAVKLAVHPTRGHPIYGPYPIFAFQNFGKGRTFFSAVDNTWRWRYGVDNLYFYKFWGQVIRFAASGRLLGKTPRYSITTDKLAYTIGEKIEIICHVFDANMKPATDETVKVYHSVEAGGEAGQKVPEGISLSLNRVKGPGSYDGTIAAEQLGRHDFWLGSEMERMATRSVTVEVPALELRDIRMNRDVLRQVAELSGGKYHDFKDSRKVLDDLGGMARSRQTPIDERMEDLWDRAWVLLFLVGLLAGEWVCRKMVKLL